MNRHSEREEHLKYIEVDHVVNSFLFFFLLNKIKEILELDKSVGSEKWLSILKLTCIKYSEIERSRRKMLKEREYKIEIRCVNE